MSRDSKRRGWEGEEIFKTILPLGGGLVLLVWEIYSGMNVDPVRLCVGLEQGRLLMSLLPGIGQPQGYKNNPKRSLDLAARGFWNVPATSDSRAEKAVGGRKGGKGEDAWGGCGIVGWKGGNEDRSFTYEIRISYGMGPDP